MRNFVAVFIVSAVCCVACGSALSASRGRVDPCPPLRTLVRYPGVIEDVVAGARQRIPKAFAGVMDSQGTHPPVTRESTILREVLALNLTTKQANRFRAQAAKVCGKVIAYNSWAVVVEFPAQQTLRNEYAALLARTRSGWYLYGVIEEKI